jgi:hypothetical protein
MSIYSKLYHALAPSGYPVREQGSFGAGDTLPETLITYQILDQPDISHADNAPRAMMSYVRVAVYSKDPATLQGADQMLRALLTPDGFLRAGGRGLPFDPDTEHYGYVSEYRLYEEV